jgi:ABC-type multidrug transport system fused ATPase/permease subunit
MAIACTHLDQIRGITSRDKHVCEERCLIRTEGPMLFLTERVSSLVPIFANSVILADMKSTAADDFAIEFRDVSYTAPTGQQVLSGLNLEVRRGQTLVLLGRSGSGKTTTLKLVNRLLSPSAVGSAGERRGGRGCYSFAPKHRICHSRWRSIPAFHRRAEHCARPND